MLFAGVEPVSSAAGNDEEKMSGAPIVWMVPMIAVPTVVIGVAAIAVKHAPWQNVDVSRETLLDTFGEGICFTWNTSIRKAEIHYTLRLRSCRSLRPVR